jgi:hypothetical protein
MTRPTLLAAIALLALAGCDRIPFLQGGGGGEANSAAANASGNASAAAPANSGIGQSRSLAGLSGNSGQAGQGGQGGKDPTAIPASSSEGGVDPRLVGRWTDTGDCKTVTELRPDGTFVATSGVVGRWEVNGNDLIFSGNGNEYRLRIDSLEPGRVVTTTPEGQSGASTRC